MILTGVPAMTDTSNMTDKQRRRHYEVEDAMHTMRRAGEIVKDKKLMAEVKAMAKERAEEMEDVANRAEHLARAGRISEKQMAKLNGRKGSASHNGGDAKGLNKTAEIA